MPATNSILGILNVLVEALCIMVLNEIHALSVQLFDALPNQPIVLIVVAELEATAPMTEVTADDEQRIRLLKVGKKKFCIVLLHFQISSSDHNGHQLDLIT